MRMHSGAVGQVNYGAINLLADATVPSNLTDVIFRRNN